MTAYCIETDGVSGYVKFTGLFSNSIITATNTGAGILKFIVSTDGGIEWKTWNGSAWEIINADNSDDIKNKGMSVSVF